MGQLRLDVKEHLSPPKQWIKKLPSPVAKIEQSLAMPMPHLESSRKLRMQVSLDEMLADRSIHTGGGAHSHYCASCTSKEQRNLGVFKSHSSAERHKSNLHDKIPTRKKSKKSPKKKSISKKVIK